MLWPGPGSGSGNSGAGPQPGLVAAAATAQPEAERRCRSIINRGIRRRFLQPIFSLCIFGSGASTGASSPGRAVAAVYLPAWPTRRFPVLGAGSAQDL